MSLSAAVWLAHTVIILHLISPAECIAFSGGANTVVLCFAYWPCRSLHLLFIWQPLFSAFAGPHIMSWRRIGELALHFQNISSSNHKARTACTCTPCTDMWTSPLCPIFVLPLNAFALLQVSTSFFSKSLKGVTQLRSVKDIPISLFTSLFCVHCLHQLGIIQLFRSQAKGFDSNGQARVHAGKDGSKVKSSVLVLMQRYFLMALVVATKATLYLNRMPFQLVF